MLFFLNLDGTVTRNDAERIYQGANDGKNIQLVSPLTPLNTSVEVAFTYPNGLVTTYYPLAVVGSFVLGDFIGTQEQLITIDAPPYIKVYLWQISLPENVTANEGTVVVTFKITKPANIESYEDRPTTGEAGIYYYAGDETYYVWDSENQEYVITDDTIDFVDNAYVQISTSPCPFTVEYAVLPSPPDGATPTEIEQILTLLNLYYSNLAGRVSDVESGSILNFGEPTATATTLQPNEDATASVEADPDSPPSAKVFNFTFGIPKGEKGDKGDKGDKGNQGAAGTNGTNGTDGKDALFSYSMPNIGSVPEVGMSIPYTTSTFNRTPIQGEAFLGAFTRSNTAYLGTLQVSSVGSNNTICSLLSFERMTGERGERGLPGQDGTNGTNGADGLDGLVYQHVLQKTTDPVVNGTGSVNYSVAFNRTPNVNDEVPVFVYNTANQKTFITSIKITSVDPLTMGCDFTFIQVYDATPVIPDLMPVVTVNNPASTLTTEQFALLVGNQVSAIKYSNELYYKAYTDGSTNAVIFNNFSKTASGLWQLKVCTLNTNRTYSISANVSDAALQINNLYTGNATSGQVPASDGNGHLVWKTLPNPMLYKGTLGVNGTITSLPTADASNEGFTYKVITDGTYASQSASVGDIFISNGSEWTLIPSGDDSSTDTWRNIKVNGTELLGSGISTGAVNFKNGSNVTITGSGNDITIAATVPTKTSDLTNDSGFLTSSTGVTSVNGSTGAITDVATTNTAQTISGVKTFENANAVIKNTTAAYSSAPSPNNWNAKFLFKDSNGADFADIASGIGGSFNAVEIGVRPKNNSAMKNVRITAYGSSSETPSFAFTAGSNDDVSLGLYDSNDANKQRRWKELYLRGFHLGENSSYSGSRVLEFQNDDGTNRNMIRSASDGDLLYQSDRHYFRTNANTNGVIIKPQSRDIYPETNGTYYLGTDSNRFSRAYIQNGVYDYGSIAVRGVDANANYTGYFLVAYAENIPTYQPATAKIIAEDFDTVGSCYEIDVSAYFGFDSTNNVKTYGPRVRAISSTGSDPVAFSKNNILVVMRTTNSTASGGTNRAEIWYRGTATYSRFKFTFLYDAGQVRTDSIVKWTKVTSTSATDAGYVSAGNTVYLDSSNQFPTFIPTASWSTNAFITSQYVAANISANSMSNMMSASTFRAYATTPNIEGYMAGDDYNTKPSANQGAQFLARDASGQWMGGLRIYHTTGDKVQTQLIARSPKTSTYSTGVMIEQDASATSNNQAGTCRFVPFGNETVDLGTSSLKWRNIYGVNVYATSDRRLKENIKDAELDCGKVIDNLPIKEFNFKSDEDKKVIVGAIAQELMEILPEKYRATLVSGSEDTSYSINEGKLLFVAIGALKDEMKKTKDLEARLERIEKLLEK